jgi:hypothetical protein
MSEQAFPPHGVMEGKGAYNRHARVQASGVSLAVPFLESAARKIVPGPAGQPIVIVDYGSSQGKNSLMPLRAAIDTIRSLLGANQPILVFHVDQPANDFNTLFEVLDSDADRYTLDDANVFPSAIGRSFYERVLPCGHVHLAWSSYAVVWLSRIPTLIPGHFHSSCSTGAVRAEFERQAARDWESFLAVRASELRPDGRLVVVLPTHNGRGSSGFVSLMHQANAVLAEMVDEGAISIDERERMTLGSYSRQKSDLLAPFGEVGRFCGLTVEACEVFANPDSAWEDFERDDDKEALAAKHASFFRSTFVPSLASALEPARDAAAVRAFSDRLENGVKLRLTQRPAALELFVQTIVLAKQHSEQPRS